MNLFRKIIFYSLFVNLCLLALSSVSAQQVNNDPLTNVPQPRLGPNDTIKVPARIIDNEVVPGNTLEWIWVQVPYPPELLKKRQEMTRLRNAVYVTYPYAVRAGFIINDINNKLSGITDRSERKKYIRTREKELKKEFGDPLTNLSVYQGKVLMKLINRQTGNNCYDILKEYKGGFNARIFQTVAFVFGTNLKQSYEPNGDDKAIENIVQEVQRLYGRR